MPRRSQTICKLPSPKKSGARGKGPIGAQSEVGAIGGEEVSAVPRVWVGWYPPLSNGVFVSCETTKLSVAMGENNEVDIVECRTTVCE